MSEGELQACNAQLHELLRTCRCQLLCCCLCCPEAEVHVQVHLQAPEPPFEVLSVSDLLPESELAGYCRAGGAVL